ncbi:unnamed protein product [Sphenostylis stenocarpa]|uniref:Uncharacterized protein n=1 Tax=Sphenostylis stenocarpa TaxID=92480 RepID=A0AA86TN82_9FABA|nr:unnamed protein product [Sphenostylis stenocarpa]
MAQPARDDGIKYCSELERVALAYPKNQNIIYIQQYRVRALKITRTLLTPELECLTG